MGFSTSSGDHGEIRQGWSQEESASPHVIGDTSGATRQTSFSAQANATSDLLLGKMITVDGPFDSMGNVLDVTLTGDQVSTSSYDVDSKFLPVRDFPAVTSGHEEAALDLLQRMYGEGTVTLPWTGTGRCHAYYPMRGYSQGFTVDGQNQPYFQGDWAGTVTSESSGDVSYYWGHDAVIPTRFVRMTQGVYCTNVKPFINPTVVGDRVNYMAFRVRLDLGTVISAKLNWQFGGSALSPDCFLRIGRTTGTSGTIGIDGAYRQDSAGSNTTITPATVPTTGLDMSKEIGFVIQWGYLSTAATGATLRIKIYAYDPEFPPGGAPSVVLTTDLPNAMRTRFVGNNATILRTTGVGSVVYGFRDVIISQTDNTWPVHYPVIPEPSLIAHNFTKTNIGYAVTELMSARPPIPAWSGSGWEYLKMLTSARGLTARVENGQIMVRDLLPVGTVEPISGTIAPPRVRQIGTGRARSVDVIANRSVTTPSIFDPVNFRDELSANVRIDEESTFAVELPDGVYFRGLVRLAITDSDGRPIAQSAMHARGARFTPDISRDGRLRFSIRGPRDASGLGVAPWTIDAITVTNEGIFFQPETITLYTGAAESMVTRDKAGNVDNPFLNSQADVWERASWLISEAGSPQVTISFEVPESQRARFQVGQVISDGWTHYRVMSTKTSRGTTSVDAVWFTTQAAQTAQWSGQTANQWNTYWSGKRAIDAFVRPLSSSVGPYDPTPFVRAYPSQSKGK